jgi:histidine triad (HIT) family protein
MADCIFCKIIGGEIPALVLVETDQVISFLDINPVNPGHALVVPRRHAESLLALTQDELHAAALVVRRVAAAVVEATGSPAFNVLQNNGQAAGQIVRHVHYHVIPRRPDDGFALGWRQLRPPAGQLEGLQQAVRALL